MKLSTTKKVDSRDEAEKLCVQYVLSNKLNNLSRTTVLKSSGHRQVDKIVRKPFTER